MLEGGRYNDGYLGCPELATTLSPELSDELVIEFFKVYQSQGLSTGCVIRPSEFDFVKLALRPPENYLNNLRLKIRFAREHWKCKLFYIDTNMELLGGGPILPEWVFARLHNEFPDVLMIPEYGDEGYHLSGYYDSCAPYMESFRKQYGTPKRILEERPNAFSVVSVCDPADINSCVNELKERLGKDVLLFNGDGECPSAAGVRAIYGL
jgi:hypothetical protein